MDGRLDLTRDSLQGMHHVSGIVLSLVIHSFPVGGLLRRGNLCRLSLSALVLLQIPDWDPRCYQRLRKLHVGVVGRGKAFSCLLCSYFISLLWR